jgi:hypothetical protein
MVWLCTIGGLNEVQKQTTRENSFNVREGRTRTGKELSLKKSNIFWDVFTDVSKETTFSILKADE